MADIKYRDLIRNMTFVEYCQAFGTLWLTNELSGEIEYMPWNFWNGQDGEPGQLEFAWLISIVKTLWAPKARQKGISELCSLYAKYTLEREPGSQVKIFSLDKPAAREFLELRFARKVLGHAAVYPEMPGLKWEIGKDRCECENGSYIQVYSSEDSGARGGSQRFTILDEAREFAKNDLKNMLQAMAAVVSRGKNQLAVISSGKPGSEFNARIKGTVKSPGLMKLPVVRPSVWMSADKKEGMIFLNDYLDPEHRVPGWREATLNGSLYGGDEVRFNQEHPEKIEDLFVSHEGKVLAALDAAEHRRNPDDMPFMEDGRWNPDCDNYLTIDHGNTAGHPTVAGFFCHNRYTNHLHQYDGVFARSEYDQQMSVKALRVKKKVEAWLARGAPTFTCIIDGSVFNDLGVKTVGSEWEELTGLSFLRAQKADKDGSVIAVAKRVFNKLYTINPLLAEEWQQLDGWLWDTKKDSPVETEDDECFTAATEVLTPSGWKSLASVELGDVVGTVSQEGIFTFEPNIGVVHKNYSGPIHSINEHGLEFTATDGHRHAVISQFDWKIAKRFWVEKQTIDEIMTVSHWPSNPSIFPTGPGVFGDGQRSAATRGRTIIGRAERIAWIAGIWLAEGCFDTGRPTFIIIDQKKKNHKLRIKAYLEALGWTYSRTKIKATKGMERFVVSRQPEFRNFLEATFGKYAHGKIVAPEVVMKMSAAEREYFYDGYMCGDGCRTQPSHHYDSVSKNLMDGIQVLGATLGRRVRISSYKSMEAREQVIMGRVCNVRQSYRGSVQQGRPTADVYKKDFKREIAVDLPVHCVKTRTGFFWARTNGKPFVAGNCDIVRYTDNHIRSGKKPVPPTPLERGIARARAMEAARKRVTVTPPVIQQGFGGIGLDVMRQLDGAGTWQ